MPQLAKFDIGRDFYPRSAPCKLVCIMGLHLVLRRLTGEAIRRSTMTRTPRGRAMTGSEKVTTRCSISAAATSTCNSVVSQMFTSGTPALALNPRGVLSDDCSRCSSFPLRQSGIIRVFYYSDRVCCGTDLRWTPFCSIGDRHCNSVHTRRDVRYCKAGARGARCAVAWEKPHTREKSGLARLAREVDSVLLRRGAAARTTVLMRAVWAAGPSRRHA